MIEENMQNNPIRCIYRPSFDKCRTLCMILLVLIEFGLYFIPYFSFVQPFMYFAQGTLFTIYGYIVLRDGADLRKNILHALKVFIILLVVYGLITAGYLYLASGNPLSALTRRYIFNIVVLNLWPVYIGASIWYVQATLYSLIIFWLFRKYKKWDWLVCIVLFVIAILFGEFAGLINFEFLGYTYIPGNFLTRAMPYMLLGRLIKEYYVEITSRLYFEPVFYFLLGIVLSIIEYFALGFTGYLVYPNHLIGFILMAAAACIFCVSRPPRSRLNIPGRFTSPLFYKTMFYTYNPLGYIILCVGLILSKTETEYIYWQYAAGVVVLLLTAAIFVLIDYSQYKYSLIKKKREMRSKENET